MMTTLAEHLSSLRDAVRSLPAVGPAGFEGLIREALHEITGVPFRLAGSGSQFGKDGSAAYDADGICFEGKRYDGDIPANEVITKIAQLGLHDDDADIWVLGASAPVKSQIADDARGVARKTGVHVLILDWQQMGLPAFAVALAMGGGRVGSFLEERLDAPSLAAARAALAAIRQADRYQEEAARIRVECDAPSVGARLAREGNIRWLTEILSSRRRAKAVLGQPLCPGADEAQAQPRADLSNRLAPLLTGAPDGRLGFVLGEEGNGKSWLVAQSWLEAEDKPLLIMLSADEFAPALGRNDIPGLLIDALVRQTGGADSETIRKRFRRWTNKWADQPQPAAPRVVVYVDGINQRPGTQWPRILEALAATLDAWGGRLIVSARTAYFSGWVRGGLSVARHEITIPPWTPAERNKILAAHGIAVADLEPAVARQLCNPRLLAIALALLDEEQITTLTELSASRLLFEHLRTGERDAPEPRPVHQLARDLSRHAQDMLDRAQAQRCDDLGVFEADVPAVVEGRFLHLLEDDPSRYELKEEGLTLALGFLLVDRLRAARRNGRDLDAALAELIEPLAALDDTARVIHAAITVCLVEEPGDDVVAAALLKGFADLQNPDQALYPALAGLARRLPLSFLAAARDLFLNGGHQPNADWLKSLLFDARENQAAWEVIAGQIRDWLSLYSLSPDLRLTGRMLRESSARIEEERERNRQRIADKLRALSDAERSLFESMYKQDGDLSALARLGFTLLAGRRLEPFAQSFVSWSFAAALNADLWAPHEDFTNLARLNRTDWADTRAALHRAVAALRTEDVSETGRWALVYVLRATGAVEDARAEGAIVKVLTADRPRLRGWREVERYSAADPCDPASYRAANVDKTEDRYAALDVSTLHTGMGVTTEDHFFTGARPAMARFAERTAIERHRALAAQIVARTGLPLRQGLFELRAHTALLSADDARALLEIRLRLPAADENDVWITSQYALLLAFPFLSACEQAKVLTGKRREKNLLLDLGDVLKPPLPGDLEAALARAAETGDEHAQYVHLVIAAETGAALSTRARAQIAALSGSPSERVRAQAIGLIASSGDEDLLLGFAQSTWSGRESLRENGYEAVYGSAALLEAASNGLLDHLAALERIAPAAYARAAGMLNTAAVAEIARRVDLSISYAAGLQDVYPAPDVELEVRSDAPHAPQRYRLSERPSDPEDTDAFLARFSEDEQAHRRRQLRNREAFDEFRETLSANQARIILEHWNLEEFEALLAAAPEFGARWHDLFMGTAERRLPAIHNLALLLAHALGKTDPEKAARLFTKAENSAPLLRIVYGRARITLDMMAHWAGADDPVLDRLRVRRLDSAASDHKLALEVQAALRNNRAGLLERYVADKLERDEPAEIARGLMVAGFSDVSPSGERAIARFADAPGFLGAAARAARYAYERNRWARHWFAMMCKAADGPAFWQASVLFLKIVDGRFSIWREESDRTGPVIGALGVSLSEKLRHRYERWGALRKRTLFGEQIPAAHFMGKAEEE